MLHLKQKEILVTAGYSFYFLDLKNYKILHQIEGYHNGKESNSIIELPNGFLAISTDFGSNYDFVILIVDPINYTIVKTIREKDYFTNYSSLCVLNNHSFIYVLFYKVMQISIDNDYQILYKSNNSNDLDGHHGMISLKGGEYILVTNGDDGISVVKPCYELNRID